MTTQAIFVLFNGSRINERRYQPWQEAIEREVDAGEIDINELVGKPVRIVFAFPEERTIEPLRSADALIAGVLARQRQTVEGAIEISTVQIAEGLRRIAVKIVNLASFDSADRKSRDDALMQSLVSMHVLLGLQGGEFISSIDPPDKCKVASAECKNAGLWPVLIGTGAESDTMLAAPIILYDYPQIAPESPGNLFDATEIDEILSLRILTLTDDEKRSVAGVDPLAGDLLARTESLAREQLMNLHGTIRGLRPVRQEQAHA